MGNLVAEALPVKKLQWQKASWKKSGWEEKIIKIYNNQDITTLISSSLMTKPFLQYMITSYWRRIIGEDVGRTIILATEERTLKWAVKNSGRLKVLKYFYRETYAQCSEERVQKNMTQRSLSHWLLSISCFAWISPEFHCNSTIPQYCKSCSLGNVK